MQQIERYAEVEHAQQSHVQAKVAQLEHVIAIGSQKVVDTEAAARMERDHAERLHKEQREAARLQEQELNRRCFQLEQNAKQEQELHTIQSRKREGYGSETSASMHPGPHVLSAHNVSVATQQAALDEAARHLRAQQEEAARKEVAIQAQQAEYARLLQDVQGQREAFQREALQWEAVQRDAAKKEAARVDALQAEAARILQNQKAEAERVFQEQLRAHQAQAAEALRLLKQQSAEELLRKEQAVKEREQELMRREAELHSIAGAGGDRGGGPPKAPPGLSPALPASFQVPTSSSPPFSKDPYYGASSTPFLAAPIVETLTATTVPTAVTFAQPSVPPRQNSGGHGGSSGGGGPPQGPSSSSQGGGERSGERRQQRKSRRGRSGGGGDDGDGGDDNSSDEDNHGSGTSSSDRENSRERENRKLRRQIDILSKSKGHGARVSATEAERVTFSAFPDTRQYRAWMVNFRSQLKAASCQGLNIDAWISKVRQVLQNMPDHEPASFDVAFAALADPEDYPSIDAKISAGLTQLALTELQKGNGRHYQIASDIVLKSERLADQTGHGISGRQAVFLIGWHNRTDTDSGFLFDIEDMERLSFNGDNELATFATAWHYTKSGLAVSQPEGNLRHWLHQKLENGNAQVLKEDLAHYARQSNIHPDKSLAYIESRMRYHVESLEKKANRATTNTGGTLIPAAAAGGLTYAGKSEEWAQEHKQRMMKLDICFKFNNGSCVRGDACTYKHIHYDPDFRGRSASPHPAASAAKGEGKRGKGGRRSKTPPPSKATMEKRKITYCPFHAKGHCTFGDSCHYSHDTVHKATAAVALPALPVVPLSDSQISMRTSTSTCSAFTRLRADLSD